MKRSLCCGLLLAGGLAAGAGAQCVLESKPDGYVIGWVRSVESSIDSVEGCVTDISLDLVRAEPDLGERATMRMLGGRCGDSLAMETVAPGGRRTFSVALDELAFLAFCRQDDTLWVLDKGTLWADGYRADSTGVRSFIRDLSGRRLALEDLRVYRTYRAEVLRSPDPTDFYTDPEMRRETWFLQQVKIGETPEPTVREVVSALNLSR